MLVASLTRDPIDTDSLLAAVAGEGMGATVLFVGSVRRSAEDGPVTAIEYSTYEEMAREEVERIIAEAAGRWPDARCVMQHRVGTVPTGEPSIAVVAGAPHRAEAFEACRFLIEQAKLRLPVWKREEFEGGGARWREHDAADSGKLPEGP
ncbi:MAG: molybdenum cofactor biosynthesis protein MoaE [Gemmatimonadales bacterium]